ncbi:hypothetical protein BGP_5625 [Beggiatoa sp. PS]|nr:hypothetical protein BGP_5625 [Beggiatoa sp. PS]
MPDLDTIVEHFKTSKYDHATPKVLSLLIEQECLTTENFEKIFQALLQNPNNKIYLSYFYYRYAMFHLAEQNYALAIQMGKQALALKDSLHLRLKIIKWLMADKQFDEAMAFLTETKNQLNPIKRHLYRQELTLFEAQIPVMQELHEMGFELKNR